MESMTKEKNFVIQDLKPHTDYDIKVEAKNKDVWGLGLASYMTATTAMGVPPLIENFTITNATVSWLTVSWHAPEVTTSITQYYNISLHNATSGSPQWNETVTAPQAEFGGLQPETNYTAEVTACNRQNCGPSVLVIVSTLPRKPSLTEGKDVVEVLETTDTTVTLLLPLLDNPPGYHYVVLERTDSVLTKEEKEHQRDAALSLVEKEEDGNEHWTDQEQKSGMYIAAKVKQEIKERLQVPLGDGTTYEDRYENRPLKNNAAYQAVVVTEKRNGPFKRRWASPPLRFVLHVDVNTWEVNGTILGVLMAVAFVTVVIVLYLRRKRRNELQRRQNVSTRKGSKSTSPSVEIPDNFPGQASQASAVLPYVPQVSAVHNSNTEPLYDSFELLTDYPAQTKQICVEEKIYSNETLMVAKEDLEAYLLRAVMSTETKEIFAEIPPFFCHSTSVCDLPENRPKNRHNNKLIYDKTRVILPLYDNIPHTDYINANFVEGPGRCAAFIATQGPMDETVGAFWRMVWHTKCSAIVMVANTTEHGKTSVAQYWPETKTLVAEGVSVTPEDITNMVDFTVRTFSLSIGSTRRPVTQYQYTAWPDNRVPWMAHGLANMLKMVRQNHSSHLPITVHCSSGIGRTGVVVLVLYLLEELEANGTVCISRALLKLIHSRGRLIETVEQYIFAHQVLHVMLFSQDTAFPCHTFSKQLAELLSEQRPDGNSPLQEEFKKLKKLPKDVSFKFGKDPSCAHLNRNKNILPADNRLLLLEAKECGKAACYLNVIRVNSADKKDAYIAGEHPMTHTLAKMWKLVYDKQIEVWLSVHTYPPHSEDFPHVLSDSWPQQNNMTLKASEARVFNHYDEQEVEVCRSVMDEVVKHKCVLLSFKGWPANQSLPASPQPLLDIMERAMALAQNQKILITCRDGVTGCGVVTALLVALRHTKLTQEVNIYQAAASVMQDRPEFIVDQDQYKFLHLSLDAFLGGHKHLSKSD